MNIELHLISNESIGWPSTSSYLLRIQCSKHRTAFTFEGGWRPCQRQGILKDLVITLIWTNNHSGRMDSSSYLCREQLHRRSGIIASSWSWYQCQGYCAMTDEFAVPQWRLGSRMEIPPCILVLKSMPRRQQTFLLPMELTCTFTTK